MYRLNLLPRNVIISIDEVIRMAPIDGNSDARNIESAIIIAEERFVRKFMGYDFYDDFRNKKNVEVTSINIDFLTSQVNIGNTGETIALEVGQRINAIELVDNEWYRKWWNEFGWKLIAECVTYIATPTNYSKYTSQGQMQNSPKLLGMAGSGSGSSSVDLKDIKWTMDKLLMDRIDPLIESSHEWLCKNRSWFSLYNSKPCPCESELSGVSFKRKTGWIHNVYDDEQVTERTMNVPVAPPVVQATYLKHTLRAPIGVSFFEIAFLTGKEVVSITRSGLDKGIALGVNEDPEFLQLTYSSGIPKITLPTGDKINQVELPNGQVVGELFIIQYKAA